MAQGDTSPNNPNASEREDWLSLPDVPLIHEFDEMHTLFIYSLNQTEFIAICFQHCRCLPPNIENFPILKYDSIHDSWSTLHTVSRECMTNMRCHYQIAFDQHKMYAIDVFHNRYNPGSNCDSLIMFDFVSSKIFRFEDNSLPRNPNFECFGSGLIIADGIIHVFRDRSHFQWDHEQSQFIKIRTFHEFEGPIKGPKLIHVPSKNHLLLIGGNHFESDEPNKSIWRFQIEEQLWDQVSCEGYEDLEITAEIALSPSEEHVIFCKQDAVGPCETWILDIRNPNQFKWRESKLRCPEYTGCIVTTGWQHETLVTGWVKRVFSSKEFVDARRVPRCLVEMIASWVSQQQLHFVQTVHDSIGDCTPPVHRTIPLKFVLG